jgi:predicted nucleotidyltransferase
MKSFKDANLHKRERESIRNAAEWLKANFPIERVILFGSRARGDFHKYSDVDLLLISSRPLHWKEEKAVVEALFDLGVENGMVFSPLFASSEEWDGGIFREFPIYREIVKEGAFVP